MHYYSFFAKKEKSDMEITFSAFFTRKKHQDHLVLIEDMDISATFGTINVDFTINHFDMITMSWIVAQKEDRNIA